MPAPINSCLLAVMLSCHAGIAAAATLNGTVARVIDGDTVTVIDGRHRKIKVRLSGIDAPEKRQAFGREAGANLTLLIMGKPVAVEWHKRDVYGRLIGRVLYAPATCSSCTKIEDAGLAQINSGYAWSYRDASSEQSYVDKQRYAIAENAARASRRGLWADAKPVSPWQWRHGLAGSSNLVPLTTMHHLRKVKTVVRHPLRSVHRWIRG